MPGASAQNITRFKDGYPLQEGRVQLERLYARSHASTGQGNVDAEEQEVEDGMDQGAVVLGEQTSDTEHE